LYPIGSDQQCNLKSNKLSIASGHSSSSITDRPYTELPPPKRRKLEQMPGQSETQQQNGESLPKEETTRLGIKKSDLVRVMIQALQSLNYRYFHMR
jgi:hypothetical protein